MTPKFDIKKHVLVLRKCNTDFTSKNGFKYPKTGWVCAPDWRPDNKCGGGLHGLPFGIGDSCLFHGDIFQIILVSKNKNNYLYGKGELKEKCKFRRGYVLCSASDFDEMLKFITKIYPDYSGYRAKQTAGDGAKQNAGSGAKQTAGDWAQQTAGDWTRGVIFGKNGIFKINKTGINCFLWFENDTESFEEFQKYHPITPATIVFKHSEMQDHVNLFCHIVDGKIVKFTKEIDK